MNAQQPWRQVLDDVQPAGCYATYLPPGVRTSYGEALRAPVGRLHRAGSDIAVRGGPYMDGYVAGAVRGGRAAAAAIRTPRS